MEQSRKVKFMKKKIFLIISMCLMLLGLTACSETDPTTVDYNGVSYDTLKSQCESTYATLAQLSEDDKANYLESGTDMTKALINSWDSTIETAGKFINAGECKVTKSGDTLTVEQEAECANRKIVMTYVYDYDTMAPTSITVDCVYTIGETMGRAGQNTVMGILIVFAMLILISLIIKSFEIIPKIQGMKKKAPAVEEKQPVVNVAPVEEVVEETDDLELVAVIAAAIAASTGTSTDDFVVRSIKRRR